MTDPKPLPKAEIQRTASARAKQHCRDSGLLWDWCESYNASTRRKKDLFGLFDLVHFEGARLTGVQVTQHNGPARVAKMRGARAGDETQEAADYRRRCLSEWLRIGHRAEVWDYRQRRKGGRVVAVERVVLPIEMGDMEGAA